MKTILLPYGNNKIPISIPQKSLIKVCWLKSEPRIKNYIEEIENSIKTPIESPRISQISKGKNSAVIISTDISRPTPDNLLIPPILNELNKGGISDNNIEVIMARGQHRKMNEEEIKKKAGIEVLRRVKVAQHDPDSNLFYLGNTKKGNALWVNKNVVKAEVKISTGNIVPHRIAGYGGGAKNILPGISSRETIGCNHLYIETGEADLGKIEGNPIREEAEEAAKMIGLNFIVNTVMNDKNEIVKIVTGDPVKAHRAGVNVCKRIFGVKIPEKADIVVTSSYPMDMSFYQASKALVALGRIIKDNSSIIMVSPCYEGMGGTDFLDYLKEKTPEDIIKSIKIHKERNIVKGVISYLIAKCKEKAKIYLVSEGLRDEEVEGMGMFPVKSTQSILDDILAKYGQDAKILVLPSASITLPFSGGGINLKKLLTGNEAVAEGIIESGVEVVCGYPGTPSTEVILTLLPRKEELGIHIEWSTNEKIASEIAAGVAWAGKRALVTMKMSGVNVAVDSLASIAYSGCIGGLVVLVADDPGANAGMPEQDSRYYAKSMVVPMLDLASQQECLDYVKLAFYLEKIGGPIFLRSTTDISHVASDVEISKELKLEKKEAHFERDIAKYTKAGAACCMAQHRDALGRLTVASKISDSYITESGIKVNETHFNNSSKQGVIYAGAVEGNFREALKRYNLKLSWLKIGMVHPLPEERIKKFLKKVDRVLVLEELDPLVEAEVMRIAHLLNKKVEILGKFDKTLSPIGNYSFKKIKDALEVLLKTKLESGQDSKILERAKELKVKRPTSFCIGCPHRGTYFALNKAIKNLKYKKDEIIITGDIGCTILGMNKPFESCWTEVAMGASIGLAQGFKWAGIKKPVIATIGDSTFFHAGIPPLINAVYQKVFLTVLILDNGWTAMTGFEENPGTINLKGVTNTKRVDIAEICQGCGIEDIQIDPYQSEKAIKSITKAIEYPGVSVVVFRRECALQAKKRKVKFPQRKINIDKCSGCRVCLSSLACPAMVFHPKDANSKAYMEITSACFGCGLCEFTCSTEAIEVIKDGK